MGRVFAEPGLIGAKLDQYFLFDPIETDRNRIRLRIDFRIGFAMFLDPFNQMVKIIVRIVEAHARMRIRKRKPVTRESAIRVT